MRQIKKVPESDLANFVPIFRNAYPGFGLDSEDGQQQFVSRIKATYDDPARCLYGLYEDGNLLGTMMLYDFTMTLYDQQVIVGGVGQIAVDLLHKKEKIAKDMITYFMEHFREKGGALLMLYPFRPDFYKQMGFGYGTKISHYQYRPTALPKGESKANIRFLGDDDALEMLACYNRYARRTHGMVIRTSRDVMTHLANPARRIIGHQIQDRITGYLVFDFEKGSTFIRNNLRILELVYEETSALRELMTFLHTQFDQIDWIVHNTHDELFHHMLYDPRNETRNLIPSVYHESNSQGVGLMYRVIDIPGLFESLSDHDFGGQSCLVKLVVDDTFQGVNPQETILELKNGKVTVLSSGEWDVTIRMDIADFSSLIMGVIDLDTLYRYGLAKISDYHYVNNLSRAFKVARKPECMTHF